MDYFLGFIAGAFLVFCWDNRGSLRRWLRGKGVQPEKNGDLLLWLMEKGFHDGENFTEEGKRYFTKMTPSLTDEQFSKASENLKEAYGKGNSRVQNWLKEFFLMLLNRRRVSVAKYSY